MELPLVVGVDGSVSLAVAARADCPVIVLRDRHGHIGLQLRRVAHAEPHHAYCPVADVPQRA